MTTTTLGAAMPRTLSNLSHAATVSPLAEYVDSCQERVDAALEKGGFLKARTEQHNWRCAELAFAAVRGQLRPGAILAGPTGRGKTCLAEALKSRIGGCPMSNITVDFGGEWEPWVLNQAFRVPEDTGNFHRSAGDSCLWVLDDVGAEEIVRDYGNVRDCFARFILRWDRLTKFAKFHNPLLITTNLSKDGIRERYGDRILSRLLPLAWCPFKGVDKRDPEAAEHMEV